MTPAIVAYRMRWKRRRLIWRAFRSRHQLRLATDKTAQIKPHDILSFATMRNEMLRLPHFLDHYRRIGVAHFLIVDNDSSDGTADYLRAQPDVSLWSTTASYKAARFGMDWINHLLRKYGTHHWCVTVDADELLIYPNHDARTLTDVTAYLDHQNHRTFGTLMLELYPKGPLADQPKTDDPLDTLTHFDPPDYTIKRQQPAQNLWVQGGVRQRVFFHDTPDRAPTLNKIPLVKWQRGDVYLNSTHSMLPPKLNAAYVDFAGEKQLSGALLHTKFLPDIVQRATSEKARGQHFGNGPLFDDYYDALSDGPDLSSHASLAYEGWQQLETLGLMKGAPW